MTERGECQVMAEEEGNQVMAGREKMSGNGKVRKMSGNDDKKGKVE